LDRFESSDLMNVAGREFTLRYYAGYPEGTVTIYLPIDLAAPEEVAITITSVLQRLKVPESAIRWHRY
jgi:hypothetical protein